MDVRYTYNSVLNDSKQYIENIFSTLFSFKHNHSEHKRNKIRGTIMLEYFRKAGIRKFEKPENCPLCNQAIWRFYQLKGKLKKEKFFKNFTLYQTKYPFIK